MFTCHPRSQQVPFPASLRPEFGQMYLESHLTSLGLSAVFWNAYSPVLRRLNCECTAPSTVSVPSQMLEMGECH